MNNIYNCAYTVMRLYYSYNSLNAIINFEKTTYSVDENDEFIQLVLILSNPVNKDFTAKILSSEGSADGEYLC